MAGHTTPSVTSHLTTGNETIWNWILLQCEGILTISYVETNIINYTWALLRSVSSKFQTSQYYPTGNLSQFPQIYTSTCYLTKQVTDRLFEIFSSWKPWMPWRLFKKGNCHLSGDSRVSRDIWWRGWRHENSTPMMMSLPYCVTCVHVRHVIFDDVADLTSFLHQWRWACHLGDKRRCECSLSPARRNELELKDSSFLTLGNCNKGTETHI